MTTAINSIYSEISIGVLLYCLLTYIQFHASAH